MRIRLLFAFVFDCRTMIWRRTVEICWRLGIISREQTYFPHANEDWNILKLDDKALKHVGFGQNFNIQPIHLVAIADRPRLCTQLRTLRIGDGWSDMGCIINDDSMLLILTYAVALEHLIVCGPMLEDQTFILACRTGRRLKALHINGSFQRKGQNHPPLSWVSDRKSNLRTRFKSFS